MTSSKHTHSIQIDAPVKKGFHHHEDPGHRTDPALDLRRVLLYAAALVAIYTLGIVVIIATHTQTHPQLGFLIIMFAPMAGALLARFAGPGAIQWGDSRGGYPRA